MLTHQGRMGLAPTTFTCHSEFVQNTIILITLYVFLYIWINFRWFRLLVQQTILIPEFLRFNNDISPYLDFPYLTPTKFHQCWHLDYSAQQRLLWWRIESDFIYRCILHTYLVLTVSVFPNHFTNLRKKTYEAIVSHTFSLYICSQHSD